MMGSSSQPTRVAVAAPAATSHPHYSNSADLAKADAVVNFASYIRGVEVEDIARLIHNQELYDFLASLPPPPPVVAPTPIYVPPAYQPPATTGSGGCASGGGDLSG